MIPVLHASFVDDRLGPFPFWRGDEPFLEVVDGIYAEAAGEALELLADPVREGDREA